MLLHAVQNIEQFLIVFRVNFDLHENRWLYAERKRDLDCRKTAARVTHCCRDFESNSNLNCHAVSACVGHF